MGGKCYSKPRNSLQPPPKPSNFGGDIQTDRPTACVPVPKISNAMNNDGVITLRDLSNELEKPLFMQKKPTHGCFYEGKRWGWKFSNRDVSISSRTGVDCTVSHHCPGEGAIFKARGEVPCGGPLSRSPPQPGSPAALLRIHSTGFVHTPRPETITGRGLAAAISSLLGA